MSTSGSGPRTPVHGEVDPAFESVREAFVGNFVATDGDRGDLGAGLCVIADGRVVVDLWGGWSDLAATIPWAENTLVNAYSVGKALTAVTVLTAVSEGSLDLDEPLASVWPEYGVGGKERTTLREALAHRAGVPGIDRTVADEDVFDFGRIASAIAATKPWWEPGTAHGYHVNTLGHLVGEPLRRATGQTVGTRLRELVAGPLGADVWIGLPLSEHGRVAHVDFIQAAPEQHRPHRGDTHLDRMRSAAYFNPPGLSGIGTVNTERWRLAEVPSTNLHATARGVALVFDSLLRGGATLPSSLVTEAARTHSRGHDLVLDRESRMGLGMMLHQDDRPIGVTEASFGHFGNGGSLGFADPVANVAFGYVLNRPGDRWQVPRTRRILAALRACLAT